MTNKHKNIKNLIQNKISNIKISCITNFIFLGFLSSLKIIKQHMKNTNKKKGNRFENLIAKQLGVWMFDDKYVFGRHQTSGAIKAVYSGDIVPIKQINWSRYPFLIECKNGYRDQLPNFNKQAILRKWLVKADNERTIEQTIVLLIARFHGFSTLFITSAILNPSIIQWDTSINVEISENRYIQYYIYKFDDVLKTDFLKLHYSMYYL